MKHITILLATVLLSIISTNAGIPCYTTIPDDDEPVEIPLGGEQNGEDPTPLSTGAMQVSALKYSEYIEVSVSNFTGNVIVCVVGNGEQLLSPNNLIVENGIIHTDIAALSSGYYHLMIYAGSLLEGYFIK